MPGVKPEGHLLGEDAEDNPSYGFGYVDEQLVVESTDRARRPATLLETLTGKARLRDYVLLLIIVLVISD